MHLRLIVLVLLGLCLTSPDRAAAWHRAGHHAIARITWKQLDDGQRLQVSKVLKAHPHYDVYLADKRPKDVLSEPEWVFLQSSTWADWVRSPDGPGLDAKKRGEIKQQFNKPVWHYVDLPFIHPKDAGKFDEAAIRKEILEPYFDAKDEPRHALAALEWSMKKLKSADTPDADRAVALCWLMHVAGDLHQPLHGTSLIASKETMDPPLDPPGGDLGGNGLVIKVKADDARAVNLHFFWDAALFRSEPDFSVVDGVVAKLLTNPKLQRDQMAELKATSFLAWAEESRELAKSTVYMGKDGFLKAQSLPPNRKSDLVGFNAPPLPAGYSEAADEAAARRMVLAGYRLADQLGQVFKATR
jgi:hypothetical protein